MQNKRNIALILSALILVIAFFWSVSAGVYPVKIQTLVDWISGNPIADSEQYVLMDLRLPRAILAILMGSALAVCGTCLQGLFRNPLATPSLIGITSGASLFAAIAIVVGASFKAFLPEFIRESLVAFMAFLGALLTLVFVYRIATKGGKTRILILLLAGVAVSALAGAVTGFLTYISSEEELRSLTFWSLGSLAGANWTKIAILGSLMGIAYLFLLNKGKSLNAMMLGEREAEDLGQNVEKIKKQVLIITAVLVGCSVSFAGAIGFVGLIVPYILRMLFSSNYQFILPLSAVAGSILLLIADTASRIIAPPSEIPIGILTAFFGAPVFIVILLKSKKMSGFG